ncbi:DUF763 domain-containing protein [Chitinophaga filiformis]|uniref:DUF763 domain-containing protein n=1 Tax=Chitinophaga filiformis TaxID=104663 RepID=A0A1G7ZJF8_CHIFI|nr:DUF763 domain-containing protein [Chitinophaga filiformis]SDH08240.1 hypothetical protein SAMN04488121_108275 [Chitinophaga filiformis]
MSGGHADLPLHYGHVPPWLARRMSLLGGAIVETIVADYGKGEVLRRLSDPCWFQALGCVLGMDWHSSGITTSVMGALKKALNPRAQELGIYICGGKGKHSKETPAELLAIAERTGLPGQELVRCSKLAAKVDNTAVQDGFQLYLHSFIVSSEGEWAVVQQGMNDANGMARRYHWHSTAFKEFTETPHTFIYGHNQGLILNLTDKDASSTKSGMLQLVKEKPAHLLPEIRNLIMPSHHDVRAKDVDLKRLGSVLAVAHERQLHDFESLLLLEGVGPRTLQSLTLVSEVIHGTPSRFTDPARFSFAHGGKDGHPFPVPVNVYDETISVLKDAVNKAKIGQSDKQEAIRKLSVLSQQVEKDFIPNARLDELIQEERDKSWQYGGRTVMGKAQPPDKKKGGSQLSLF